MMIRSLLGRGGRDGTAGGGEGMARFAMLAEVRGYWEGLRDGAALPRRDQIDPRGIAGALESTFLLERVAPGVARFRLAGMQLHDLMGMDVRGMPLTALIEPLGRSRLTEAMETVFATPGILELWLEGERGIGRPALEGRMLVLPLISSRGVSDLALGCLALEGGMGRAPRRFAIAGLLNETIERRFDGGAPTAPALADRVHAETPGLAEPAGYFRPIAPRPPRGKPNLRLVVGGVGGGRDP
jgi:hypothetical protein